MAVRNPLVIIDGTMAELPTGDSITGTSGSGLADGDKGDITVSGGATVWSIDAGVVTLAKQANVATATILGRVAAAAGVPEALTGAQATTILNAFTSTLKGMAPASGGGTVNFLRADGTWATPASGGGLSDGDKGDIIVTGSGTILMLDAAVKYGMPIAMYQNAFFN